MKDYNFHFNGETVIDLNAEGKEVLKIVYCEQYSLDNQNFKIANRQYQQLGFLFATAPEVFDSFLHGLELAQEVVEAWNDRDMERMAVAVLDLRVWQQNQARLISKAVGLGLKK